MSKESKKKRDFFWISYADLMTSLFFVMLVLFVLFYSMQSSLINQLKKNNSELLAAKEELDRIKEIEKTVNNINKDYFVYDSVNKKHILNVKFLFPSGSSDISKIYPNKVTDLISAGKAIKELVLKFPEEENIKYLVVIEGQASKDSWSGNDDLSFHRAESLIDLWKTNHVGLDKLKNCEVVIAGSGEKGIPRETPDLPPNNQRFLITIIPKIGEMKKN
jgi:hypothetical protein